MAKTSTSYHLVLCLSTLVVICLSSKKIDALSPSTKPTTKFLTSREILCSDDALSALRHLCRGGAIDDDDDYDAEYDVDEYDSDVDEDVESVRELATSAISAVEKAKKKKAEEAKKTMNKAILKSKVAYAKKTRKKSRSLLKKVPYIFRAFINPFTVLAMTRGYFASFFNIDYLEENEQQDSSQTLRSALEEKAKMQSSRGKKVRKMKPGQSKSLSDLPALNT